MKAVSPLAALLGAHGIGKFGRPRTHRHDSSPADESRLRYSHHPEFASARQPVFAVALVAVALLGVCTGGKKSTSAGRIVQRGATAAAGTAAVVAATPPAFAIPITPVATLPPTASPAPTPSPTPTVRIQNGLQIQDVSFSGTVAAAGGLRIRSSPDSNQANVVGSVTEGSLVNVEGRVLNGTEAEQGQGTVWCIVGVNQYVYCHDGYIVPAITPTPSPAPTPTATGTPAGG